MNVTITFPSKNIYCSTVTVSVFQNHCKNIFMLCPMLCQSIITMSCFSYWETMIIIFNTYKLVVLSVSTNDSYRPRNLMYSSTYLMWNLISTLHIQLHYRVLSPSSATPSHHFWLFIDHLSRPGAEGAELPLLQKGCGPRLSQPKAVESLCTTIMW